ncbi:MAG: carboxylesterase/lipase family protein [Polyangiaceae bacterium]
MPKSPPSARPCRWLALAGAAWLPAAFSLGAGALGCSSSSGGGASPDGGTGPTTVSNAKCMASVTQGALEGTLATDTCEYLGIPYGAPPTGALRFMPPQPAAAWKGTRNAKQLGATCIQASALGAVGGGTASEDCLFVNVYTPQHLPAKPLPVMVFIHGGAYTIGSGGQYDPRGLSEAGPVVAVTFNYRLGALGFLALPDLDAQRTGAPSGSDGIRDQQLALEWVKDNIATFGGDPGNVTVFGESAGAMSTCIHIASPGSQGLAQRFLMESGSCVNGPLLGKPADRYELSGELLASVCPADADGGSGALDCLRSASATAINTWTPSMAQLTALGGTAALTGNSLGAPFYPIVEGAGGVLPDTPENLIRAGKFAKSATVVAGTNAHEWGLFADSLPSLTGMTSLQVTTVAKLQAGIGQIFGATNATAVEQQYMVNTATDAMAQSIYIDLVTDYTFRCPARDLARLMLAHGTSTFYLYLYDFGRSYHSDELPALFTIGALGSLGGTPPSAALAKDMKAYWTQFAATGSPNGAGTSVMWPQYATATDENLVLADPPMAGSQLDMSNCDFWDGLNGFLP